MKTRNPNNIGNFIRKGLGLFAGLFIEEKKLVYYGDESESKKGSYIASPISTDPTFWERMRKL